MSILSEILATKRTEVACLREHTPTHRLQESVIDAPPVRDFVAALHAAPRPALIAEVKKASPSKGVIRADFDPLQIAHIYEDNGAACLSVLTDEHYFQGHIDYLRRIRAEVSVPLLRKDFIIDPWQIVESRAIGADAILLIVAALPLPTLRQMLDLCRHYSMAALVEVHNAEEMQEALEADADLIGINNRDLHTFHVTLNTTLDLIRDLPADRSLTLVSESGISTRAHVEQLGSAGVHAVLVGESLMREADIGAKLRELINPRHSIV